MTGKLKDLVPEHVLFAIGGREVKLLPPSLSAQISVGRLLKKSIVIDDTNKHKTIPDLVLDFAEMFLPELVVLVVEDSNPGERITTADVKSARFSITDFLEHFMKLYELEKQFAFLARTLESLPALSQTTKPAEGPNSTLQ